MVINFDSGTATAKVVITQFNNIGPEGWRHVEVTGLGTDETAVRMLAEEIKRLLLNGRETHWRVPFEYKQEDRFGTTTPTRQWRLFSRFSFRQNIAANDPSPENIDPRPEPLP